MAAPFPSATKTWHTTAYPAISPSRPELSAKGKIILITGGGTGIGAETARSFAEAGASRIAILGRREQPLLDTKASIQKQFPSVEILAAPTDITSKAAVDAAFTTFAAGGKIDILVSNAAILGPLDSIQDVDGETFLDAISKNLSGSLNVAQAFLRHAATDAIAIETSSALAHLNLGATHASYSVAKLAVFRLWDSVAFANSELNVFHVQPGVVRTEMSNEAGGVESFGVEDHGK